MSSSLLGRRLGSLEDILSSLEGADKALAFLSYSAKILSFLLGRQFPRREWSTRAQWFYGSIEDARTIHRLFGLLANFRFLLSFHSHKSAETTRRHSLEHPLRQEPQGFWHPSKILSFLTHMQNFSLLVCNPLEHAAWFASNILELPAETSAKWDRWSCMAWSAWIVLEVILHMYKYWQKLSKMRQLQVEGGRDDEVEQCKRKQWILSAKVWSNVTELPIALNWSFEEEPLPDVLVGVFGALSSLIGFMLLYYKYDHDENQQQ